MRERTGEHRLSVRIEYVGILMIACLFAGVLIGGSLASRKAAVPQGHEAAQTDSATAATLARIQTETNPDALIDIGNHAYDNRRPDIAIPAYEKALTMRPNDPNVLTDLGTMYLDTHQPMRAVDLFRRAAALDPKHPQSRFNLGVALAAVGDKDGARKAFQEVLRTSPDVDFAAKAREEIAKLAK